MEICPELTKKLELVRRTISTVATIVFRLILAKFRPNSDQKNTEIQTKFRLILTIFNRNSDLLKLANWVRLRLR